MFYRVFHHTAGVRSCVFIFRFVSLLCLRSTLRLFHIYYKDVYRNIPSKAVKFYSRAVILVPGQSRAVISRTRIFYLTMNSAGADLEIFVCQSKRTSHFCNDRYLIHFF